MVVTTAVRLARSSPPSFSERGQHIQAGEKEEVRLGWRETEEWMDAKWVPSTASIECCV
jgi:hypothetical protein